MSTLNDYLKRREAVLNDTCNGEDKVIYSANYYEDQDEKTALKQVGGSHYQVANMQVWDIIDAYHLDPYTANIIKYALRFPYKAGRQDIEKLIHYAEKLHTVYDDVKEHYYAGA
jgi:hypothetical protein